MWCESDPYFFPSTLVKKIFHNQLKKQLFFFTFGHSKHPNFLKKSHNSGPISVLRKQTHIYIYIYIYILDGWLIFFPCSVNSGQCFHGLAHEGNKGLAPWGQFSNCSFKKRTSQIQPNFVRHSLMSSAFPTFYSTLPCLQLGLSLGILINLL